MRLLLAALLLTLSACGTPPEPQTEADAGVEPDAGLEADAGLPPPQCAKAQVPCEDEVIQQLSLQKTVAPGLISSTPEGTGFAVHVDATAGGFNANPPHAFVYAKFTASGLQKVELDDEKALESMDWDIAFRRYLVRINSGNSGPSCVSAFRLPGTPPYESVKEVPETVSWNSDLYFTDTCEMIVDGTGLGSPNLVLSGYWSYPGCVKMTGNVYLLKLRDGRVVKLTVTSFYSPETQPRCQTNNQPGSESGNLRLRYQFLAQ
ncbi:MAG: HmuY family protein [Myxococcales bacterium]